jgi:phosphatidylethanolamine/phosphatidyl-N-methylethanolamine N-methyltransferase
MDGLVRVASGDKRQGRTGLFLKRWLRNPLQMGSLFPSSPALGRRIAQLSR